MSTASSRILISVLALALFAGCVTGTRTSATTTYYDSGGGTVVTVEEFGPALSPYGEWVYVPGLGRAWRPYGSIVGYEFQPYATGGTWVYTDVGWTFQSDYPFAWATFHYGRWAHVGQLGWVWVPGTRWAPAWVSWRYGGGYVGWAPLGPHGYVTYYGGPVAWTYVHVDHFHYRDPYQHRLPPNRYHEATAVTRPPAGRAHTAGPPPSVVGTRPSPPPGQAAAVSPPPGVPGGVGTHDRAAIRERGVPEETEFANPYADSVRPAPRIEPAREPAPAARMGRSTPTDRSVEPGVIERAPPSMVRERSAPDRFSAPERTVPGRLDPPQRAADRFTAPERFDSPQRFTPAERTAPDRFGPPQRATPQRAVPPPERYAAPTRDAPSRADPERRRESAPAPAIQRPTPNALAGTGGCAPSAGVAVAYPSRSARELAPRSVALRFRGAGSGIFGWFARAATASQVEHEPREFRAPHRRPTDVRRFGPCCRRRTA